MLGWNKFLNFLKKILKSGASPKKLAISFCLGVYIAFSPFPGLHAVMMFFFSWLWGLNFPILFFATSLNNPWTLIPFYSTDYFFGYWLIHDVFGWNPDFSISLAKVFGSGKICITSFLIGGNVLGVVSALLCYPLMLLLFTRLSRHSKADL